MKQIIVESDWCSSNGIKQTTGVIGTSSNRDFLFWNMWFRNNMRYIEQWCFHFTCLIENNRLPPYFTFTLHFCSHGKIMFMWLLTLHEPLKYVALVLIQNSLNYLMSFVFFSISWCCPVHTAPWGPQTVLWHQCQCPQHSHLQPTTATVEGGCHQ